MFEHPVELHHRRELAEGVEGHGRKEKAPT
jgi:hypothetical protein